MERKRVALAKMLVLLVVLTVVSWLLLQWPAFTNADTDLLLWVNSFYDVTLANILYILTFLGSVEMGLIWVALLFVIKRRDLALYVLVAILIEIAYVYSTKAIVDRPRPYVALPNIQYVGADFGQSFPSGHAAGAFTVAVVLGMRVKKALIPLLLISIAVAASRVYIGVHYPFDAIAGAIAGIIIGYTVARMDLSPVQAYFAALGDRLKNR
ncbi:MAG TPA: phosphatase PAP2 family protein, partial [Methanomassiliicoccales archaeon]|nr:phosphatase PAP2 family protein [Methanomassiliicoccales archaeon]